MSDAGRGDRRDTVPGQAEPGHIPDGDEPVANGPGRADVSQTSTLALKPLVSASTESAGPVTTPAKILIVDGEDYLLAVLQRAFSAAGYGCVTARDAEAALNLLRTHQFSVALIDLAFFGLAGMVLLDKVRREEIDVAVLILSGQGDTAKAVQAMRRGAFGFVAKPAQFDVLRAFVEKAALFSQMQRRIRALERLALDREAALSLPNGPVAARSADLEVVPRDHRMDGGETG